MRLRVLTFNVWNTQGDERKTGLIRAEIERLRPDLLSLQEVVREPGRDQLSELLEGTGLHATHQHDVLGRVPPSGERFGGSAVATRWPHETLEALDLRLAGSLDVPWATLAVRVPVPEEGDLLFIGATTSWRLAAEAARERQVVAIADLDARHRTDLPTVIAGDLNAAPDAASIRYLTGRQSLAGRSVHYHDAWEAAGEGPGFTWDPRNPAAAAEIGQIVGQPNHRRRVDHVLLGGWDAHPKAHARVESARLVFDQPVDGVWLSDHFGVLVEVEVGMDQEPRQSG
jgi:endonuclease/exonuclease/phosphatase family metal-dependent hydrolase